MGRALTLVSVRLELKCRTARWCHRELLGVAGSGRGNKKQTGREAKFFLSSGSGNHLQSLSLEPPPLAFPKKLLVPHTKLTHFCLKSTVISESQWFTTAKVCLYLRLTSIMGGLRARCDLSW